MSHMHGVSAIVPAYNEASTILHIIRLLERHPRVCEVIVVSDGSTDDTVELARSTSARVIDLPNNAGKGAAMEEGVHTARFDVLLFVDADLKGLTNEMISLLIHRVTREGYDMFTLIRDRASEHFQLHLPAQYAVGGERALTRKLWEMVPTEDRQGFGVELGLNYYAYEHGMRIGHALAPGLSQVSKEIKRGLLKGLWMRLWMVVDCAKALWKLHILHRHRWAQG